MCDARPTFSRPFSGLKRVFKIAFFSTREEKVAALRFCREGEFGESQWACPANGISPSAKIVLDICAEVSADSRTRLAFRREIRCSPDASSYFLRNAISENAFECHHRSDSRRGFNSTVVAIGGFDRSAVRRRDIIGVRRHSFPATQFPTNYAVCRVLFANRALSARVAVASVLLSSALLFCARVYLATSCIIERSIVPALGCETASCGPQIRFSAELLLSLVRRGDTARRRVECIPRIYVTSGGDAVRRW